MDTLYGTFTAETWASVGKQTMSKLWVDYTNHSGRRAWREIAFQSPPFLTLYPPAEAVSKHPELRGKQRETMCVLVWMHDRNAQRLLALTSIHGFRYSPADPAVTNAAQAIVDEWDGLSKPSKPADPVQVALDILAKMATGLNGSVAALDAAKFLIARSDEQARQDKLARPDQDALAYALTDMAQAIEKRFTRLDEKIDHTALLIDHRDRKGSDDPNTEEQIMTASALGKVTSPRRSITLDELTSANAARQKEWDKGDQLHGNFDILYRANEVADEVGELCNKVKKLVRDNLGIDGSRATLREIKAEIGDAVICVALLAADLGLDLNEAVAGSFNDKSRQLGMKTRL